MIESDLYRVVLSNRGAVVRSWQLTKYTDEARPPRTLDLVQADLARQTGGWPFSLQHQRSATRGRGQPGALRRDSRPANGAVNTDDTLSAPAEVEFHWSDGQLEVTKR